MRNYQSIEHKLILRVMLLISIIFSLLLSLLIISQIISIQRQISFAKHDSFDILVDKGISTVTNISLVTGGINFKEKQYTTVQDIFTATIKNDSNVVYIIYTDTKNLPIIHSIRKFPLGTIDNQAELTDSVSLWASQQKHAAHFKFTNSNTEYVEFAIPVFDNNLIIGHLRLGITLANINNSMTKVALTAKTSVYISILIIVLLGILSLSIGYLIIKRIATQLTQPINSLVNSTHQIIQGNYNIDIKVENNDEIGRLATDFIAMKDTVQKYTGHLQEIIDEKMLQVTDILNNIEQGLFTINLDGKINNEYSAMAKKILKIDNISSSSIQEILRMDAKQNTAFYTWLDLVKKKHSQMRWQKLSRLAPVQEIELTNDNGNIENCSFVSISYQRIYDSDKQLSKIMILAMDITEKRLKDLHMAAERQRHENDVKAILSIANSTAEEISEFMEDTTVRLDELLLQVQLHLDRVIKQRKEYPDGEVYVISGEAIDNLYRDLHTIKGNSGSYGFDLLSTMAHQAEDQLEKLRQPVTARRQEDLRTLEEFLMKMKTALDEIHQKIQLIFGESEEIFVRIPEFHVNTIINMCDTLSNEPLSTAAQELIYECKKLSWKPLGVLLRKYQKSALQVARKLHKNVEVVIKNEKQFFNPLVITRFDEILLHLVRNAVDHGIESPEIRDELGKSTGKIYIEIDIIDELLFLVVADDGRGIDVEALLTNAVNKKFITPEETIGMSNDEKIALLFRSGLSTSKVVSEISGRGMGMDIVKHRIEELSGSITTNSIFGQGTTFCIKVPVHSLT